MPTKQSRSMYHSPSTRPETEEEERARRKRAKRRAESVGKDLRIGPFKKPSGDMAEGLSVRIKAMPTALTRRRSAVPKPASRPRWRSTRGGGMPRETPSMRGAVAPGAARAAHARKMGSITTDLKSLSTVSRATRKRNEATGKYIGRGAIKTLNKSAQRDTKLKTNRATQRAAQKFLDDEKFQTTYRRHVAERAAAAAQKKEEKLAAAKAAAAKAAAAKVSGPGTTSAEATTLQSATSKAHKSQAASNPQRGGGSKSTQAKKSQTTKPDHLAGAGEKTASGRTGTTSRAAKDTSPGAHRTMEARARVAKDKAGRWTASGGTGAASRAAIHGRFAYQTGSRLSRPKLVQRTGMGMSGEDISADKEAVDAHEGEGKPPYRMGASSMGSYNHNRGGQKVRRTKGTGGFMKWLGKVTHYRGRGESLDKDDYDHEGEGKPPYRMGASYMGRYNRNKGTPPGTRRARVARGGSSQKRGEERSRRLRAKAPFTSRDRRRGELPRLPGVRRRP